MRQVSSCQLLGFRLHAHVKYNVGVLFSQFHFLIETFLGLRTARTGEAILMVDGSKPIAYSDLRKCLLGVWSTIHQNLGHGSKKTPNFRPHNAISLFEKESPIK
jgi:hypothetical protein